MEDDQYIRPRQAPLPKYHNPPPVVVPRSQFATRPNVYHSTTNNPRPRNFSSPFRTPLNSEDRHQSFVEHQRSTSNEQSNDGPLAYPQYPRRPERTSYAFFETRAPNNLPPDVQSSHQDPSGMSRERIYDVPGSSRNQPGVVRQASIGHKAKPALLNVKRSDSTLTNKQYEEPKTPPPKAATIEALNNAIAAAVRNPTQPLARPSASRSTSKSRMPFDSPTSTYSQEFQQATKSQARASSVGVEPDRFSTLEEEMQPAEYHDPKRLSPLPGPTPHSEKSTSSTNPLLGLGIEQQGMSARVPKELRPPRLDIKAVRDMESRGSITSLPDLIRRATRLAANLDRGKTASRLGMLDMLTNFDHLNTKNRESTFTDALDEFQGPADSTPSKKPRPTTMWPNDSKALGLVSEKQVPESQRQARRCCGLTAAVFISIIVVLIILIAAAVLIPIFLVAVPRQHNASSINLASCPTSRPCQNDGISVIDNNACSCICVDGFTGNDCSKPIDDNCATATIIDGSRTYENATLGSSVVTLLSEAQGKMNVPLNASVLLSVFANYNLSCASENSLVRFDTSNKRNQKRLFIVPGLDPDNQFVPNIPVAARQSRVEETATAAIAVRQNPPQTSNDVVFQSSSARATTTATLSKEASSASLTTSSSASAVPTARANVTSDQLEFASLVVLFVLAGSRVPSTAVVAQQNIEQYFRAGALASGNSTVDVVQMGDVEITANFAQLAIILSNGKVIGGTSLHG